MKLRLFVYSTDDKRFEDFKNHQYHKKLTIVRIKDVSCIADAYKDLPEDVLADLNLWVHDDVRFLQDINDVMPLAEYLLKHDENAIVGVAGAKDYGKHIAWWNRANNVCGKVVHTKDNLQWTTEFGPLLKQYKGMKYDEVRVVDGLFMMMTKKFYVNAKPFANIRSNHFYDIRACFNANRCYVIDFPVLHYSIGELTEGYAEEAKRLIEDYGTRMSK